MICQLAVTKSLFTLSLLQGDNNMSQVCDAYHVMSSFKLFVYIYSFDPKVISQKQSLIALILQIRHLRKNDLIKFSLLVNGGAWNKVAVWQAKSYLWSCYIPVWPITTSTTGSSRGRFSVLTKHELFMGCGLCRLWRRWEDPRLIYCCLKAPSLS